MKSITTHYILAVSLTLLLQAITWIAGLLLPDIGWHILTIHYIAILLMQLTFYWLTTNFNLGWTALSFTTNFILWTLELVAFEKIFNDTWLYQDMQIGVLLLGGLLWATNKILLDKLFGLTKLVSVKTSNLDRFQIQ